MMLIACFGLPGLADEPSAPELPTNPGAEFEASLELDQAQANRKLLERTDREFEQLLAQQDEHLAMLLERGDVMRTSPQIEVMVVRSSRSSSRDVLRAVAKYGH